MFTLPEWPIRDVAGEWPRGTAAGPGDEMGIGEGTCNGLDGELASRPEPPGEGWGNTGDGLIVVGRDGGDARLKEVAGLEL